jgi:hypothetical protein
MLQIYQYHSDVFSSYNLANLDRTFIDANFDRNEEIKEDVENV